MGAEILPAAGCRTNDLMGRAAETEQGGVDPAGSEKGAEDFTGSLNRKFTGVSSEVDFPAVGVENPVR